MVFMSFTKAQQIKILKRCKKSFIYFCENFCKIKHPNAGEIPFKLFEYQKDSVRAYRKHNRVIYRKCRQSGISTLTGAYVLWFAMFYPTKKCLIVSKRDEDAIAYLDRNVKFVYETLKYGEELFYPLFGDPRSGQNRKFEPPKAYNEHTIIFHHGSEIKSLTSSKETLRSNTASLIIVDEAAFIADMDAMWAAGQPTLMHGGRVIVISTSNGRGNWYCNTWEDTEAKDSEFHPIIIPWWNMNWFIEYWDDVAHRKIRIAPCDNIEECKTEEDKAKYGPYKSPWLLQQYRELQEKGEAWKFRQEILMEFIGAGNTVLNREALLKIAEDIDDNYKIIDKPMAYTSGCANVNEYLDFQKGLWIWNTPVRRIPPVVQNNRVIKPGEDGHRYVIGVDVSTGEANDWSVAEIIDVTAVEQAAELRIKTEMHQLSKMVDYLGRLYNNALVVVERNGGYGESVIQDLRTVYFYPNLFHRRMPNGKKDKRSGFPTSASSKGHIVKAICENMGTEERIKFKSARLYKEACSFIHLGSGKVGNEPGTNNNDDLMIGAGLALVAMIEAMLTPEGLIPTNSQHIDNAFEEKIELSLDDAIQRGGHQLAYPILSNSAVNNDDMTVEEEINKFIMQIGGVPLDLAVNKRAMIPAVTNPKKFY